MTKLSFLDGSEPVQSATPADASTDDTGLARDSIGRFATPEPEASAESTEAAAPGAEGEDAGPTPATGEQPGAGEATTDPAPAGGGEAAETDKERADRLEAELRGVKGALTESRAKRREELRKPAPPPTSWTDEDIAFHNAELEATSNDRVMIAHQAISNISYRAAVAQHGQERVDQVRNWTLEMTKADPRFNAFILSSDDPYQDAVEAFEEYEDAQLMRDPANRARLRALLRGEAQPQPAAGPAGGAPPSPPAPAAPPSSITKQPSAGGLAHVPNGPGQAYDGLFKER